MPALDVLKRLRTDTHFFAQNLLKIKVKSGNVVPLVFNQAQQHVHNEIEKQLAEFGRVRAIVLKGRQQGISTYVEARFYQKTSLYKGKTAYILTHLDKATANIFGMAKTFHDNMPEEMRPHTGAANANELTFDKLLSKYAVGTAGSSGAGRSGTTQYFHGSEIAYWKNAQDHLAGVGQTVADLEGTEIILESTANGSANVFYQMVQQALRGIGDYILIFVPWYWQGEYSRDILEEFVLDADEAEYASLYGLNLKQMCWRRFKILNDFGGESTEFDKEYPASIAVAFNSSGKNSYIPMNLAEKAISTKVDDQSGTPKIMGVDPAEYGEDGTAIAMRQGRKVLPIQRYYKRGTMEVVGLVARQADEWKPDAINVDCTGIGSGVADRLIELGYPVNRVHFGERAIDDKIYARRKDEMYGELKVWLQDSPCELPNDEVLKSDLVASGYTYDSSRRLVIESKEKIRARGLPSPDSADALGLTFAVRISQAQKRDESRRKYNWRVG